MKLALQIFIIALYLNSIYSVPVYKEVQLVPITRHRPLFRPTWVKIQISDILDGSGIFPIQINVPDTISAIFNGISTVATSIGQRIPIVQGYLRPDEPRDPVKGKEQYLYFIPAQNGDEKMAYVPVYKQSVTVIDIPEAEGEENEEDEVINKNE